MTCMIPRALALDTIALLKPLSCQAIAAASDAGAPCSDAIWRIRSAPRRPAVGVGDACGTMRAAGSGCDAPAGAGAPFGSLRTVPTSSTPAGSKPFIAAIAAKLTPVCAASAPSVSPGRTT